jgi:hypothetical protein
VEPGEAVLVSTYAAGPVESPAAPAPPPSPPRELEPAPAPPITEEDSDEGVTRPVDPALLAMAIAADATPATQPIEKVELDTAETTGDFSDAERTAIADPAAIAAALAAGDEDADAVDGPTIAVPGPPAGFDDGATGLRARDSLRPPPRGEFDDNVDVDTLVKKGEAAISLPPPPSRGKPRTMPPPLPVAVAPKPQESSPALEIAASSENSSGSIDITGLVEQLEAESAEPQPITRVGPDENAIAANAMNADELMDGMRAIGRRRPPSGPAPDLASFADPPETHGAPRGRATRGSTVDDALSALEALSFDEGAEETAVARGVRAPTPRPVEHATTTDDDDDSIEIDIEIDDD